MFSDRAAEFVLRPRSKPFYLSLHYTAPHSPWEGPGDRATADHADHGVGPMTNGGSLEAYAQMMQSLDSGIGRVLAALRRARLERDTLVIFTSDNGGERYSFNWPFSFQKLYLYEGGIRVPAIVRWPGVVSAGAVTEQTAITMDWTATILAAAGAPGRRFAARRREPVARADAASAKLYERALFWRTRTRAAARIGRWKYVQEGARSISTISPSISARRPISKRARPPCSTTSRLATRRGRPRCCRGRLNFSWTRLHSPKARDRS